MHLEINNPNGSVPNANGLTITQPWPNVNMIFGLKEPRIITAGFVPFGVFSVPGDY